MPICDEHPNKLHNDRLYFRRNTFNPYKINNRDRMDICLGKQNIFVSVLIKRADVYDVNNRLIGNGYTDSRIENIVKKYYIKEFDLNYNNRVNLNTNPNIELSNYYTLNNQDDLTYELSASNHVNDNYIKFSSRVNVDNRNEYACYDSSKYLPRVENGKVIGILKE